MAEAVGVDWAGTGWFGVALGGDTEPTADLYPSILSVWKRHADAERILIDIPIGLKDDGKRACDERAREMLRPHRSSSVFATPVRDAVYSKTLEGAKEANEPHGFSVSNQAWSIVPRIREVDELFDLFPEAVGTVRESHPEVCFAALNHDTPLEYSKTTERGRTDRIELLVRADRSLGTVYEDALETFVEPPPYARRLSENAKDDVLDALVLAYAGRARCLDTLPAEPELDQSKERPLPIEIVVPQV